MLKPDSRRLCSRILVLAIAILCGVAAGCGVRVPVSSKPITQGAGGEGSTSDPSTIRPGVSRRDETLRDWSWCDVHLSNERLFVCRVNRSTTRGVNVMLAPIPIPYAGSSRDWEIQNLLVEFDEKDLVSRNYFVSDNHLPGAIASWMARSPQPVLDLSKPIELHSAAIMLSGPPPVWHSPVIFSGSLTLLANAIDIHSNDAAGISTRILLQQVRKFHRCLEPKIAVCLDLNGMPRAQSHLYFALEIPDLLTFVRYVRQEDLSAVAFGN